jgi:hypothetical protein
MSRRDAQLGQLVVFAGRVGVINTIWTCAFPLGGKEEWDCATVQFGPEPNDRVEAYLRFITLAPPASEVGHQISMEAK